ncbi:MAG: translocation/assembly module TamB domain-containing protein, partial [Candidatus Omnitrophica bacterium]|nr:translocation/assembly module TamB domain-containing protein [Candidatus Omnitrophota bacterium]
LLAGLVSSRLGAIMVFNIFAGGYLKAANINIGKSSGSLINGLLFENIEISSFNAMPENIALKISKLDGYFRPWRSSGLALKLHNGRIDLPNSDPILFSGRYQGGILDLDIFSKRIVISDIGAVFSLPQDLQSINGAVSDFSSKVGGLQARPDFNGSFKIEQIAQDGFSVSGSQAVFKGFYSKDDFYIQADFEGGSIAKKDITVNIQWAKTEFSQGHKSPSIDFQGYSQVGGVKIEISLRGSIQNPYLKLTSNPELSQERLLIMLVTGKRWKGADYFFQEGEVTPELAKDLVDYFILGGRADKIMQRFGLSDISFRYNNTVRSFGLKKSLSENVDASYELEQSLINGQSQAPVQRIGGEYRITDGLSVEIDRELKSDRITGEEEKESQAEGKIFLRFKKEF